MTASASPFCRFLSCLAVLCFCLLVTASGQGADIARPHRANPEADSPRAGDGIYFPPYPPLLGTRSGEALTNHTFGGVPRPAPSALAPYVGENFYPALGLRSFGQTPSKGIIARLDAYVQKREGLVRELVAELANAAPAEREEKLRALAGRQAPALAQLEKEAEQLNADLLAQVETMEGDVDWPAAWNNARHFDGAQPNDAKPLRAAAYFQAGLLVEQRALLRELAFEIWRKGFPRAVGLRPPFFTTPELAQIILPPRFPAATAARIARYTTEKQALWAELHRTVLAHQGAFTDRRDRAFAALAAQQRPRLAAQAALAEAIGRDLLALPEGQPLPPAPPLPEELAQRIEIYWRDRFGWSSRRNDVISAARPRVPTDSDRRYDPRSTPLVRARDSKDPSPLDAAAEKFDRSNKAQQNALAREGTAIRESLAKLAAGAEADYILDPDSMVNRFPVAASRLDPEGKERSSYRNYRAAGLQPGLSPAQRRLLLGAAIREMSLPLPDAESARGGGGPMVRSQIRQGPPPKGTVEVGTPIVVDAPSSSEAAPANR
jgi:hypothetical protein